MTEFQEKVLKLIEEGKSPSEIKRLLNCPRTSITSVLKAYNVIVLLIEWELTYNLLIKRF